MKLIQALGANLVRLYGNDARLNHSNFLDESYLLGMKVMPGNSDWPFIQAPDSCRVVSGFECSKQVKESYAQNLQHGFLREDATYHPAISHVIVVNEPDMKLPDINSPMLFSKAIISAIDGMVEAEKEAGVTGPVPNLTVTFSWSICTTCGNWTDKPGLGQMWQLRDAMYNPAAYGYAPKNDLAEIYRTRFVNSFNTANPAMEMRPLFFDFYEPDFTETPIFIAEYHWNNKGGNQEKDLKEIREIAEASPVLLGISYFEFAIRHDIGGHLDFGIFQPAQSYQNLATMDYFGGTYGIKCLTVVRDAKGRSLPAQVARAFGGKSELFETKGCLSGGGGAVATVIPTAAPATEAPTTEAPTEPPEETTSEPAVDEAPQEGSAQAPAETDKSDDETSERVQAREAPSLQPVVSAAGHPAADWKWLAVVGAAGCLVLVAFGVFLHGHLLKARKHYSKRAAELVSGDEEESVEAEEQTTQPLATQPVGYTGIAPQPWAVPATYYAPVGAQAPLLFAQAPGAPPSYVLPAGGVAGWQPAYQRVG